MSIIGFSYKTLDPERWDSVYDRWSELRVAHGAERQVQPENQARNHSDTR
jgi:hypothetical protein